jgi:hypothetical protein
MTKVNVLKSSKVNLDKISFGDFTKDKETYHVPILYNNEPLFVQLSNLLMDNFYESGTMTFTVKNNPFITSLEESVISNLKDLIKKIKTKYHLVSKFSYEGPYVSETEELTTELSDVFKFFVKEPKSHEYTVISESELKDRLSDEGKLSSDIIIQPSILITSDIIGLILTVHQIKLNEVEKIKYVLEEYSFLESDDSSNEPEEDNNEDDEDDDEDDEEDDEDDDEEDDEEDDEDEDEEIEELDDEELEEFKGYFKAYKSQLKK